MTQEISLTESGQKTLSNGLLVSSRHNSDGTTPIPGSSIAPRPTAMLAVGNFVVSDTWRGKPVDYYVDPYTSTPPKAGFRQHARNAEFFS
jgi:aminopeptidase N